VLSPGRKQWDLGANTHKRDMVRVNESIKSLCIYLCSEFRVPVMCLCLCLGLCVYICMCVSVCVRDRERGARAHNTKRTASVSDKQERNKIEDNSSCTSRRVKEVGTLHLTNLDLSVSNIHNRHVVEMS